MNFEDALSRLAINTARIAEALESIAVSQGIVPDLSVEEEPAEEEPAEESVPAPKKAAKKKKVGKKKAKKKVTTDKEETVDEAPGKELTVKDDVRPVALLLKEKVSHAAVKALLERFGATTLHTLEARHYQSFIDEAMKDIGDEDI